MISRSPPMFMAEDLIFDRYRVTFTVCLAAASFSVDVRDLENNYLVAEVGEIRLQGLAEALKKITISREKISLNSTKGSIRLSQRILTRLGQQTQALQIELLDVGFFQPICISDQETNSNLRGFIEEVITQLPPAPPPEAEHHGIEEVPDPSEDTNEQGGDQDDDPMAGFDFFV